MPECHIHELVNWVRSGDIRIPELQREFIWTEQKIKGLIDPIYNNYYSIDLITLYALSNIT